MKKPIISIRSPFYFLAISWVVMISGCKPHIPVLPVELAYSFPQKTWDLYSPSSVGYDSLKLVAARAYADSIKTAAVMVVVKGRLIYQWGGVDVKYNTHSIRKSFLSALYGAPVMSGLIDLDKTMEDIGIDDEPPLSEEERQATIRDCLKARSGIYHPALYESQGMKDLKPARYTEKPGIHWYYNNWDFNASGSIYTQLTGKDIFEAIHNEIGVPIGMQDFSPSDGQYVTGEESIHPAYPFRVTARDLARFGLLMLNNGRWDKKQVIDPDWVAESTSYHSDATLYATDGYGYMWWVSRKFNKYPHLPYADFPEGTYSARGAGGHYVMIVPQYDLVLVHRVNTDTSDRVSASEAGKLFQLILDSRIQ
jgi:CubicO group peptidase (beta-lactamase class C family)